MLDSFPLLTGRYIKYATGFTAFFKGGFGGFVLVSLIN